MSSLSKLTMYEISNFDESGGLNLHKSNKKNILLNSLVGFMVLTNITNALRKKDQPYKGT